MKFLLDTNILSEALKTSPSPRILRKFQSHQSELATASPVWHELWFGFMRLPSSRKRSALERFLREVVWPAVPILPYGAIEAQWHALERARLAGMGKTPSFVDGQIAAIAKANDLILVTANTADFAVFQELRVENWL